MSGITEQFHGVSVSTKANVYFDGKVVSHALMFPDGSKKTLGLIFPGRFHFNTGQPEKMEIVAGSCSVKLDGTLVTSTYKQGEVFDVPGNSGFEIGVETGICEYICSFLK
ncbi:MAG: pyrimidine/purine nucleoside phosphorylase [Verrucomicrobiota bacterium]|nr:pyrimidine/purine nucleoside phosphorylase [Verrucomicrobiota bacterium]